MGTIAFASAKSSPGVTTTIAALAATWPVDRDLHVAELDPAGGDLVVRFDLATEPGLVSLAAAGRRDLRADTYRAHCQPLPFEAAADGASGDAAPVRRVLVAPVAAEQAAAALVTLRTGFPQVLRALGGDVLVDCGRLDPGSPVTEIAVEADLLVVVVRPVVAEVHHLAARVAALRPRPRALSLLTVGDQPYPVTEVAAAVGATALGTMPVDPRAALGLSAAQPGTVRALRRSPLLRDARAVAEGLTTWLGPAAPAAGTPATRPDPAAPPPPAAGPGATPGPPPAPSGPGADDPYRPVAPPTHDAPAGDGRHRGPLPPPPGSPAAAAAADGDGGYGGSFASPGSPAAGSAAADEGYGGSFASPGSPAGSPVAAAAGGYRGPFASLGSPPATDDGYPFATAAPPAVDGGPRPPLPPPPPGAPLSWSEAPTPAPGPAAEADTEPGGDEPEAAVGGGGLLWSRGSGRRPNGQGGAPPKHFRRSGADEVGGR
ncbi:MAG TPA: hypothetical protein VGJ43_06695 [Acidimicrobiales bacterium]